MFCVYVHFFEMKTKKNEMKKSWGNQDSNPQFTYLELFWLPTRLPWKLQLHWIINGSHRNCTETFISVTARNIPIAHDPSRKAIYYVLIRNNLLMHKGQDQVNFVEV